MRLYILMRIITTTVLVLRHKLCYSNILRDNIWNSYYWSTLLQYFAYTLSQSHRTNPSSGCYSLAVVAVHLLKLCCSLCYDPDYLQHEFFALISALCYPRSWAQAEWIFNHIRDTFPANELQWVRMGLKQCRLLATRTVSCTCSINHQWTLDIFSILILMCGIFAFASLVHIVIAPLFIYI